MFWDSKGKRFAKRVQSLLESIPYKSEPVETYYTFQQCLARNGGDCDDYANAAHAMLKAMGFQPAVIHGWLGSVYHAVCQCQIEGVMYVFCNALGVVEANRYFDRHMTDYKVLTDEELQMKWSHYGVR
jgi:hypothetical protein